MGRQVGKKLALFLVIIIAYFGVFSWQLLAFKKFQYSWASTAGIIMAVFYSIGDRCLKWMETPEFQGRKLVKPFILTLFIQIPIIMFVVLPNLKLPCGVWTIDSFISFYATCFFLNNASTTAIAKFYERVVKITKPNGIPKKTD